MLAVNAAGRLSAVRAGARRIWRFVSEDVWDIELSSLGALRRLGVAAVRVAHLVLKGFFEDGCPIHASALTFNTLLAVVPALILSLAVARGLGDVGQAQERIRTVIGEWSRGFADAPAAVAGGAAPALGEQPPGQISREIDRMVERVFERFGKINFTALGGVGLVVLFWMVILVLFGVETAFNVVWGVSRGRPLWRRFSDYLTALIVLPVLVFLASSLPAADLAKSLLHGETARSVQSALGHGPLRNLIVLAASTLCFSFLISFMPNTKVKLVPGLAGGLITALLFIGWIKVCTALQGGAVRLGRIYGSFAVIPIALAWVFVSWEIILLGAEVAFAIQNVRTYRMESGARRANLRSRAILALSIVAEAAKAVSDGRGCGFEVAEYARRKGVPVRFLNEVVDELVRGGLLAEISQQEARYALMRLPSDLTVKDVMDCIMRSGVGPESLGLSSIEPAIVRAIARADSEVTDALGAATIEDLVAGRGA